jgi:hypothetical protein
MKAREAGVSYKLDIFQKLGDGQLLWLKTVEGVEEAQAQLRQIAEKNPGNYFIYDARIGCTIQSALAAPS